MLEVQSCVEDGVQVLLEVDQQPTCENVTTQVRKQEWNWAVQGTCFRFKFPSFHFSLHPDPDVVRP